MPDLVISDASVLIILDKIGHLDILKKVYGIIHTTKVVSDEFIKPLPNWIKIEPINDSKYVNFLETIVDIGEATALGLASENESSLLLLPDLLRLKASSRNLLHNPS